MFSADHDIDVSSVERRIRSLTLCTTSSTTANTGYSRCYYSVPTSNPGDPELQRLQQERLKYVLDQLQKEREDTTFSRTCLFCKKHFVGNRCLLFTHLMEQHNFFIGAPDNIVFVNELLDILEEMLKKLQCFFCEKTFKDWMTLKEHMRKKQHKRINPNNKNFDMFYVINYVELGKTWIDIQNEEDGYSQDSDDKEMDIGDYEEECADEIFEYVCLYCDCRLHDFEKTLQHMKDDHLFDFNDLKIKHNLTFYSQIKLINYIRRRVHNKQCTFCDLQFTLHDDLMKHITQTDHISILPDQQKFDLPMFYFPTFENDNLLCALDVDEDSDCEENEMVYPEDPVLPSSLSYDIQRDILSGTMHTVLQGKKYSE